MTAEGKERRTIPQVPTLPTPAPQPRTKTKQNNPKPHPLLQRHVCTHHSSPSPSPSPYPQHSSPTSASLQRPVRRARLRIFVSGGPLVFLFFAERRVGLMRGGIMGGIMGGMGALLGWVLPLIHVYGMACVLPGKVWHAMPSIDDGSSCCRAE
ncbi:hypothetical protein BDV95DRAFT_579498 [Massariosphaeria phaeospora]|uniref:Uncharacterized protein n=1 Tax=Massariosphaeria phaeospora TaxID=100035 RepID=A0A7C8I271_9PLEO|nr:hypothetical protein BDV95DRAFT_579498 [Massariosphaeria phaeospora]